MAACGVPAVVRPSRLDAAAAAALRPGQSVELLKALHILTRDGRLNQDSQRKLKQVDHLFQFIEKLLLELSESDSHRALTLADHGAGKSYLGFIVYDLFFKNRPSGHIYGIETRAGTGAACACAGSRVGLCPNVVSAPECR